MTRHMPIFVTYCLLCLSERCRNWACRPAEPLWTNELVAEKPKVGLSTVDYGNAVK